MERDTTVVRFTGRETGDWAWPPYAPVEAAEAAFHTEGWAPRTCVRHPWVRVGRWTLLHRRAA